MRLQKGMMSPAILAVMRPSLERSGYFMDGVDSSVLGLFKMPEAVQAAVHQLLLDTPGAVAEVHLLAGHEWIVFRTKRLDADEKELVYPDEISERGLAAIMSAARAYANRPFYYAVPLFGLFERDRVRRALREIEHTGWRATAAPEVSSP